MRNLTYLFILFLILSCTKTTLDFDQSKNYSFSPSIKAPLFNSLFNLEEFQIDSSVPLDTTFVFTDDIKVDFLGEDFVRESAFKFIYKGEIINTTGLNVSIVFFFLDEASTSLYELNYNNIRTPENGDAFLFNQEITGEDLISLFDAKTLVYVLSVGTVDRIDSYGNNRVSVLTDVELYLDVDVSND